VAVSAHSLASATNIEGENITNIEQKCRNLGRGQNNTIFLRIEALETDGEICCEVDAGLILEGEADVCL
jgi:hypothetical protein